ncbi:MAG TPA: DUF202 domain-containing protein [Candidatus Hydrogenedentes bacterium]|nr:DUF202 domain-containing protein [Candidatus Hydrogenedentota bacterium]
MPEDSRTAGLEGVLAEERTGLAAERTVLAVERTLLAYVRTALAGVAVGGSSMTFLKGPAAFYGGAVFVVFSSLLLVFGVVRALVVLRRVRRTRLTESGDSGE